MTKPIKSIADRKKNLIDDQEHLSEKEKKKAKDKIDKVSTDFSIEDEDYFVFSEDDKNKENEYSTFGSDFLDYAFEEAKKNKEKDLPGYDPEKALEENRYLSYSDKKKQEVNDSIGRAAGVSEDVFEKIENDLFESRKNAEKKEEEFFRDFGKFFAKESGVTTQKQANKFNLGTSNKTATETKQHLHEDMARDLGVSQEKIDEINEEAEEKFGKDVFSESVDSGFVNIGADIIGGGDFLLENIVGWENNPLSKANDYMQKRAEEEYIEAMEAADRTGEGSRFVAKTIIAITESLPSLALALVSVGGSTAAKASSCIGKIYNATLKNPNFWYELETNYYPIYSKALKNGATEHDAMIAALRGSSINAILENCFGIESFAKSDLPTSWKKGLSDYMWATAGEGTEEVLKGISSGIVEKHVYDKDKQWGGYGDDSVFDLERMQNDFGMGSMSGFMDNVPKLFDISMNSYGDIYRKNKKAEDISTGKTK